MLQGSHWSPHDQVQRTLLGSPPGPPLLCITPFLDADMCLICPLPTSLTSLFHLLSRTLFLSPSGQCLPGSSPGPAAFPTPCTVFIHSCGFMCHLHTRANQIFIFRPEHPTASWIFNLDVSQPLKSLSSIPHPSGHHPHTCTGVRNSGPTSHLSFSYLQFGPYTPSHPTS